LKTNRDKIEKLFPSVYITLISILLGFAIEDVITRARELVPLDTYTILTAAAILSCVFSAWTGYSFISMTQERLPKLLDSVNVFLLALGIYLLNSTLGMEIWYFFSAFGIYMVLAIFATIYNFTALLRSLNTAYSSRIFLPNVLVIALNLIVYPIVAWMSHEGVLSSAMEFALIVYVILSNVLWTYSFYHGWSKLIHEEA
jgi:hypothetical protein